MTNRRDMKLPIYGRVRLGSASNRCAKGVLLGVMWCSALACSAASGGAGASISGAGGSSSLSTGGSTSSSPGFVILDASTAGADAGDSEADADVVACTDGDNCICQTLSVAVIGKPGVWGDASDTAFQSWLNSSSAGTARVDNYLTKPLLTPGFLEAYNVIVLAGLGDDSNNGPWWTFNASELSAFQDWIESKGGGVISLSGYSGDDNEINAKNSLLEFTGISYQKENTSPPCVIKDNNNNLMCYRCGNPYQIPDWNRTDPIVANLCLGVTMVGMDGGHPISAPSDAHVAATTTKGSVTQNWLVGKLAGKGRVLVFADEWITYTNQWATSSNQSDPSCVGYQPQDLYQLSQFWYNMIRWTQSSASCFKIVDKQQPVMVW